MSQTRRYVPTRLPNITVLFIDESTTAGMITDFIMDYDSNDHDKQFGHASIPTRIWDIYEQHCHEVGGFPIVDKDGHNVVVRVGDSLARSYDTVWVIPDAELYDKYTGVE